LRDKATKSRIPDEPERMRFQNAFNEIGVGERALESWFYRILVASRPPFAPEAKPVSTLAENALAKAEIGAAERLPAINRPDAAGKGRT